MQGERKMVKSGGVKIQGNGVSQKRHVRVYEDSENPGMGKRLKTVPGASKPITGLGHHRRPLADINNVGAGAAKRREDPQKIEKVKRANERQSAKKCEGTKGTGGVLKATTAIARRKEVRIALETKCSDAKNEKEQKEQLPDQNVSLLNAEELQKEKIHEQKQRVFSVTYYGTEIYKYLFALEKRFEIPENHLKGQVLNGLMRTVLVDWLAGVVDTLDLMQETFQLTVYTMDKFMAINKTTTKANAQLIALGALFVASKYEETESIELNDLTFFCDNKWDGKDVKNIECTILKAVEYQLGRPLAIHFIRRLSKISGASPMEHSYAKFFADTSLLSYQLCHVKPSLIAAASVFLAFCISRDRIDTAFWTPTLSSASTYRLEDFRELLPLISRAVTGSFTGELLGVRTRYSRSHLFCVSLMPGCRPETGIINHF
uniref:G2/mitotic-specific cyclin-B n=1 Tax=Lygus hesperus TaxID=30085 RepID=A0A0K8SRY7_LYGHE